jgi:hypothetical protein
MKTRNTKGKTVAPTKAVAAKKRDPGKKPPSGAPVKKNGKPAGKPSEKSASLKKAVKKSSKVRKNLPASPAPAAKKKLVSKPHSKPAGVKAKTVKKKVATPKTVTKTAGKKPSKVSIPKASPSSKKPLRIAREKIPEKTKARKAAGSKKSNVRVIKPVLLKQQEKVGSRAEGPEERSASREKGDKVFENITQPELPKEYGENELILMAVDPNVVFVDWEIKKEEVAEAKEGLTMRVFDVTRSKSLGLREDVFLNIKIEGRVGSGFFELRMPGREVAIEIGLYDNGKFLPILRSPALLMPRLLVADELGITKKMFESGIPVGY